MIPACSPCGYSVEWLRSCYGSKWQLLAGMPPTEGYYYFSDKGTPHLPFPHLLGSRNWTTDDRDGEPPEGERDGKQLWYDGHFNGPRPPATVVGASECLGRLDTNPVLSTPGVNTHAGVPLACWGPPGVPSSLCGGAMIEHLKGDNGSVDIPLVCELTFGLGFTVQQTSPTKARVDIPQWPAGVLAGRGAASVTGPLQVITLGTGLSMVGQVLSATPPPQLAVHVGRTGTLTASQPTVAIDFDITRYDIGVFFDGSHPTRLTAPRDGVYRVWGDATVGYTGGGISGTLSLRLDIIKNGTTIVAREYISSLNAPNNLVDSTFSPNVEIELSEGDYVELFAGVTSTAGTPIVIVSKNDQASPEFGMSLVVDLTPP